MHRRAIVLTLFASLLMATAAIGWLCQRSDAVPFLPAGQGAEWIIPPKSPETLEHSDHPVGAAFQRTFQLDTPPADAFLSVRVFRTGAIRVNGQPVDDYKPDGKDWKSPAQVSIGRLLQAGTNEITVFVTNHLGPPALWLRLQHGPNVLGSDGAWQVSFAGTPWQNAREATQPPVIEASSSIYGRERTRDSLSRTWPALVFFGAVSLALVYLANGWLGRPPKGTTADNPAIATRLLYGLLALVILARIALLVNDAPQLPRSLGFDSAGHEQYIRFILERHALPLANEGWEAYQPPLYYLISATALHLGGLSVSAEGAGLALRAVNGVIGLIHCWLVLLCLRRLFPGNLPAAAVGLLVASFVPPHLYLSDYVTNEPLAGLFVTLAFYFLVRMIQSEKESLALNLGLGMALGAAMLTKFSTLLALPFFPIALGARLLAQKNHSPKAWLRSVGLVVFVCLAVCGWHYGRVWAHFGRPIVGNWDSDVFPGWWQDPGFRTSRYFLNFEQMLAAPLFSGLYSFAGGIYSTLWGDGLMGGAGSLGFRPPWNYDFMNAGYLLSLGLSVLLIVGLGTTLGKSLRQPRPEWLMMLGIVFLFGLGILYMSLSLPSYAQTKAFYGFPALLPLSALVAVGWNWLAQKGRCWRNVLWVLVLTWTMTVYASFWIRTGNFETHRARGYQALENQNYAGAAESLNVALGLKPDDAQTHYFLAKALASGNFTAEAIRHYQEALRLNPALDKAMDGYARLLASHPEASFRNGTQSVQLAESACEMTHYQNVKMIDTLAVAYAEAGRFTEAVVCAEKARDLAEALGQQQQAQKEQELMENFRLHRRYREHP